jgi:hypothetical protein
MKIFGREPALWLGLVSGVVQFLVAMGLQVSPGVQTAVNAVAAGVVAVILAVVLRSGALGAALMQVATAVVALMVGLGLDWSTERQGVLMGAVALVVAFFTRTQVQAPVAVLRKLEGSSPLDARR